MRWILIVAASFLASGGIALAVRAWPHHQRQGWFELDGQPRALDGVPVRDWSHANELLARHAAEGCNELAEATTAAQKAGKPGPGPWLRQFTIDYVPAAGDGHFERVRVGLRLPEYVAMIGRHPIACATYERIGEGTQAQQR